MPIYEYRCSACGHELEALQKISEAPLLSCPACHADKLTKLVSAAGFQLKGSGWYATDFRNGSKPAAKPDAKPGGDAKAETQSDAKSDTKSETKSDTKPAEGGGDAKTETKSPATTTPAAS